MVLAGKGSNIFWGRSTTFKGGDRSVDKHQAFNPMVAAIDFPESLKYTIEKITTMDKLFPNIEFDKQLEESTVRFNCLFKDPFMLATFFTYKGVPGTWTGSNDTMTFNFSTLANQDKNIWVQMHIHDQSGNSNHIDLFLDGGEIEKYTLTFEQGKPVYESFEIKFVEINIATETDSTGAYACDIDDGFDDGSFDQTGVAEVTSITCVAAASITTGDYFKIWAANGTGGWTAYYVWFNKSGGGGDPAPSGFTEIEIAITSETAAQIATAVGAALDAASDAFGTPAVNDTVVTVTQASTGDIKDAVDVNAGFTISTTTQGVTAQDGGWSNWDGSYTANQPITSDNATPTFNAAAFSDLDVQSSIFELTAGKTRYYQMSSMTAQGSYLNVRTPWKAAMKGLLTKGNVNSAEPVKTIANKTKATMKIAYESTTKYLQFTNGRVENASTGGKEAGNALETTFDLIAGADSVLTFSWTGSEATDPSDHINHTNT